VTDTAVRDFMPWIRTGLASAIQAPDDGLTTDPAHVDLPVGMKINSTLVTVKVTAYGPGDAVSIDPRQIIRTEPTDGSANVEPNYFAIIEFHRPDLPWLFTPLGGNDQLRPWIGLLVVEAGGPATFAPKSSTNPVATLQVPDASELPDLRESFLWAHADVSAKSSDVALEVVTSSPDQAISRLMCPRQLKPDTAYLACVVPTFEAGRQSALGLPVTATDLTPAWGASSGFPLSLPVFYSWSFSTGIGGDFRSLLQGIIDHSPPVVPAGFGLRDLSVANLGYGVPDLIGEQLGTALTLVPAPPPPSPLQSTFTVPFAAMLARQKDSTGGPVVGPPTYGTWYAGPVSLPASGWLPDLNLDPRRRAIAALGVLVVHNQQEQLMASAWDQLAGIQDGNQALRHAQLAREVSTAVHTNRFATREAGQMLQATQPLHSRVPVIQTTFASEIALSSLPESVLTAAIRRLTRPQGPIARRFGLNPRQPSQLVAGLVADLLHLPSTWTKPDSTVSMVDVDKLAGIGPPYLDLPDATPVKVDGAPGWQLPQSGAPPRTTDVQWAADAADQRIPQPPRYGDLNPTDFATMTANFKLAAGFRQAYSMTASVTPGAARPALVPGDIKQPLLDRLHPENTVTNAARNRLQVDAKVWDRPDPLGPMTDVPKFPYPMSQALADLSQDLLLPGLDLLPPESAVMLAPDYGFVEAFMVGANQAMLQELLWRGFPTHQLGTCFNQFWATAESAAKGDIPPIQSWVASQPLGGNSQTWATEPLILAIRSSLFRRYPNISVYAAQASTDGGTRHPTTNEIYPILSTSFDPDIRLFGFDLTPDAAIGKTDGLGWYFVLAEHPTAARFGLEPANPKYFKSDPTDWSAASWANLVDDQATLDKLVFAPAVWRDNSSLALPSNTLPAAPIVTWGKTNSDSAQMAAITARLPVRVAIHASALLPT
jgi:hypothetical protein